MAEVGGPGPLLEARGITKWFGKIKALDRVDFRVNRAEVVGLVGDNGAGKSTLIKVLTGVYRADEGDVLLDGVPTEFASPRDARRLGIETVFQDLALVETMSICRNFFLGAEPTRRLGPLTVLDSRKMQEVTGVVLRDIGIAVRSADESVNVLSGGERQAIAIGRTMHFGARLLILDEPTSALSIHETGKVLAYIRHARERGLSVVFITHNLYHVYPIADRIVILERGAKVGDFRKADTSLDDVARLIAGPGLR